MKKNLVLLLVLVLGLFLLVGVVVAGPGGPEPQPGSIKGTRMDTMLAATKLTTNTTLYSTGVSRYGSYNTVDLFVTADFSSTGTITVTPQYAPSRAAGYVDAFYLSEAWVLPYVQTLTNASGVTATTTSTATVTGSSAVRVNATVPYQIVLTGNGTGLVSFNMRGTHLRYKLEASGIAPSTPVTVTISTVIHN